MSNLPPRKRKQAGASLRRICQRLGLPYRKTKEQSVSDALTRGWDVAMSKSGGKALAERLRSYPRDRDGNFDKMAYLYIGDDAAKFIELQEAEISRLRAALTSTTPQEPLNEGTVTLAGGE